MIAGLLADAPPALARRVSALLAAHPEWAPLPVAEAMEHAAEALLAGVLARSGDEVARDRANALDLLAADACITWAFEARAGDPEHIDELPARATAAMQRILALTGREAGA